MIADQVGTFWYHAHGGVQFGDGFFGGIIVRDPQSRIYDKEVLLIFTLWAHMTAKEFILREESGDDDVNQNDPDRFYNAILTNGKGQCYDNIL